MAKINRLKQLTLIILGGLLIMGLASCGLNKNSREWIEKNRVADMYENNAEEAYQLLLETLSLNNRHRNTPFYHVYTYDDEKQKEVVTIFVGYAY